MRVHAIQLDLVWQDRPANHALARGAVEALRPDRGDLVVLPEMFAVGFTMNVDAVAGGAAETDAFVSQLARDFGVHVIAGNVRKPDDRGRNEALVYAPSGHLIVRFEKLHPFTFATEHQHYKGGDGVRLFQWNGATVSPLICYDLRFPEAFRLATKQGAEVLVVIANWPSARVEHWVALLIARAIENQAYVVGCNRVGSDPNVPGYPGRSVVIDPRGNTIADAGAVTGVASAEIDLVGLREYRKAFPALNDIRFI